MHVSARGTGSCGFLVMLLLALVAGPVVAQTTGKVEGRVFDSQSGQPLAGAQVSVVGTRLGNITNEDGYYFINNVPAGLHEIRAQFIGYETVTVQNQRVLVDHTITVDFRLAAQAVALEALTVLGEANPLVPRDKTVSKAIVTGDVVTQLPLDNVRAVVTLQPGVVEYGDGRGQVIRGGRPGEASVYVDGVLVRAFNTGHQTRLNVGVNAVEEVNILTGGYGAEYGQAQSGIINYVSKTGGTDYSGALTFGTDAVLPKDISYGITRAAASLGGPLWGDRASFHVAASAEGREDGSPAFRNMAGADTIPVQSIWFEPVRDAAGNHVEIKDENGDVIGHEFREIGDLGDRLPYNSDDHYTLSASVRFNPLDQTKLSLSAVRSRDQGLSFDQYYQFRPQAVPAFKNTSSLFRLGLEHILVQSAERQATLKVNLAFQKDDIRSGQRSDTTLAGFFNDGGPDVLGFRFSDYEFLFENFTVDKYLERLEQIRRGEATDPLVPVETLDPPLSPRDGPARFDLVETADNPYGRPYWGTRGFSGYLFGLEETKTLDVDFDFQANRVHRFGAGIELYRKHIEHLSSTSGARISPYDTYFQNVYEADPTIMGIYIKDRMDIGEMVIDAGVRWDIFDSDARYPQTPGLLYPYQADDGSIQVPELAEQDRISTWSPRLGVAFPISEVTSFRMSYGHFFQVPAFRDLFNGLNTDISKTNTNNLFGRPIEAMKAVQFEAGLSHLFNPFTVVDITAYNKDKLADATYRIALVRWPASRRGAQDARLLTNLDFGNVRGIDVRLTRRYADYFTAILGYSLLDSKGTSSDPTNYVFSFGRYADPITGAPFSPAQAMQPNDFDQRHKFTVSATSSFPTDVLEGSSWNAVLKNTTAAFTVIAGSGLPYTSSTTPSSLARGTGSGARFDELVNSSRMPWNFDADAKINRGFSFSGGVLSAFLDVRNVLNTRNVTNVYGFTDSPVDPGNIAEITGGTVTDADVVLSKEPSAARRLQLERQQQMLQRYGYEIGDPGVVTVEEQRRATGLAYIAQEYLPGNYGAPRRIRLGFEYIF